MKPKLLVVELWGLGDLALASWFIRAATEKYDVTVLAKSSAVDLQRRCWPGVKVIAFQAPWTAYRHKYRLYRWPWRELFRIWREVRGCRFDFGVSVRWDPRDHLLLALAGARKRFGYPRIGSGVFLTHALLKPEQRTHRYEAWRAVADALNFRMPRREDLPLRAGGLPGEILLHTGAGQAARIWSLDRYKKVVMRLRECGWPVRVLCDLNQEQWWRSNGEADVIVPRTANDLFHWIDRAGVFIGNDSGPGHLAALQGVPTFTVFGPVLPEEFLPVHPQAEWIDGMPCPFKPCLDSCRFPVWNCLNDLSEAAVWQSIEKFITRNQARLKRSRPSVE